jgi:hypothetical protein
MKMIAFWDTVPLSLVMIEAVRTSETSAYYETIWRNIPEGCHLHHPCSFPAVHCTRAFRPRQKYVPLNAQVMRQAKLPLENIFI